MSIQERLQIVMKMHNLTASAFADKIGVQRSNISHVLSGRNKPGLDFLEKVLNHFPKVNAKWLICGEVGEEYDELVQDVSSPKKTRSHESKTIVKLIEIYSDGSFREYVPMNE